MPKSSDVTVVDGSVDFGGGVDSTKVSTIQSTSNPNGLASNQTAWLNNCTCRDGGITQRAGWQKLFQIFSSLGLWQSGFMYEPDNADPYLVVSISGKIYRADIDTGVVTLLSTSAALEMPATEPYGFMCQGEQFLVIQAGDYVTLPLFWDGVTLRRSDGPTKNLGITSVNFNAPALSHNQVITVANFLGRYNQIFEVNNDTGAKYIRVKEDQVVTLKNTGSGNGTGTLAAGSDIINPAGVAVGKLLVSYTIPAVGASDNAWLTVKYPGAVNDQITILGQSFQVTAIGIVPPAAGTIYAVNINQTAATLNTAPAALTSIQEITAAGPMDYFEGRLWYAIGRIVLAGDIVRGPSGTAIYDKRDSILKVTENPLVLAGDGFTVPDNAGNIRSLFHNANLNSTLGEGDLYIGTRKAIYKLEVPVTRTDWIAADSNNQPKMTVVQLANGTVNDRSCTKVNGDVWYQTLEPSIASLFTQVRNFSQWGTISLSANENRILQFNDRAILHFASGIYFDNRMLQTALPKQVAQGVVHQALIPLDFVPISSFGATLTPNWEGSYQGLDVLQMFIGDFGGRERGFAVIVSRVDQSIQLWELSKQDRFENGDNRVSWYMEFPAFTAGDIFQLKELVAAELGIDRIYGTVEFSLEYRPDFDTCWHQWHKWQLCSAKNTCEELDSPICYPSVPLCEGYRQSIKLPKPQLKCQQQMGRPMNMGYQFQCRLSVKGFCRIRGLRLYMIEREEQLYDNLVQP